MSVSAIGEAPGDTMKDITVKLRLTKEDHARWLAAAAASDMDLSKWIRARVDPPALPPEPRRR